MKTCSLAFTLLIFLAACDQAGPAGQGQADSGKTGQRWYRADQVAAGAIVYGEHCADCHGTYAEGRVADWRQKLPDGSLPPPPLNGSAHSWHHPLSQLNSIIDTGGAEYGGTMPGFAGILSDKEKLATIAYFQDWWSDEIYTSWLQMGGVN